MCERFHRKSKLRSLDLNWPTWPPFNHITKNTFRVHSLLLSTFMRINLRVNSKCATQSESLGTQIQICFDLLIVLFAFICARLGLYMFCQIVVLTVSEFYNKHLLLSKLFYLFFEESQCRFRLHTVMNKRSTKRLFCFL